MVKARKIKVSEKLKAGLGVNEEDLNRKIQELIDRKVGKSGDQLFDELMVATENLETFTKEELVVLHIDAAILAGFLEMKIFQIMKKLKISEQQFASLMESTPDVSEEDVVKMFSKEGNTPDTEDESFV